MKKQKRCSQKLLKQIKFYLDEIVKKPLKVHINLGCVTTGLVIINLPIHFIIKAYLFMKKSWKSTKGFADNLNDYGTFMTNMGVYDSAAVF